MSSSTVNMFERSRTTAGVLSALSLALGTACSQESADDPFSGANLASLPTTSSSW